MQSNSFFGSAYMFCASNFHTFGVQVKRCQDSEVKVLETVQRPQTASMFLTADSEPRKDGSWNV